MYVMTAIAWSKVHHHERRGEKNESNEKISTHKKLFAIAYIPPQQLTEAAAAATKTQTLHIQCIYSSQQQKRIFFVIYGQGHAQLHGYIERTQRELNELLLLTDDDDDDDDVFVVWFAGEQKTQRFITDIKTLLCDMNWENDILGRNVCKNK